MFVKYTIILGIILSLAFSPTINSSFGLGVNEIPDVYKKANEHFMIGEYHQAIELYDEILESFPTNKKTSIMKGIALSNLERHKQSLVEFYKVNQNYPNDVTALVGLGVGFGNFGEYKEALVYFQKAYNILPENHIVQNYYEFAKKTEQKYPYNEVEKPKVYTLNISETVPAWIKNTAGWWANDQIPDSEFIKSLQFLIENEIINVDTTNSKQSNIQTVPAWIKNTAGWWANDQIPDSEFLKGIDFLIDNGLLVINLPDSEKLSEEEQKLRDRNEWEFIRYLDRVQKTVDVDKRYIEYPNPSSDVIKKFLRDYEKWNYDQQIEIGNHGFPNPEYVLEDGVYHLEYKIYVNEQPAALPLDHVSTLGNSFKVWEEQEFTANDGNKAKIHFITTNKKTEANLWVTWVVRDLGEGVLGHANLGKGIVEVALGGYGCDGNFQLFHVDTVEYIMTHELGHGIGLKHSDDPDDIMYPAMKKTDYAYCLLDVDKGTNVGTMILKKD
tara:strand:- start:599 stop:2092 length:1494 start_codon:yes stop_codon:yes gene_type:complete